LPKKANSGDDSFFRQCRISEKSAFIHAQGILLVHDYLVFTSSLTFLAPFAAV